MDLVFLTTEGTENTEKGEERHLGVSEQCEIDLNKEGTIRASAPLARKSLNAIIAPVALCFGNSAPSVFSVVYRVGQHFCLGTPS